MRAQFILRLLLGFAVVLATPGVFDHQGLAQARGGDVSLLGGAALLGGPTSPVAPYVIAANDPTRRRAIGCLAEAVYYEAGAERVEGQRAVAQVVINRARDPNFPSSVCEVVYQGAEKTTGCQFSFTCDGSLTRRPPTAREWVMAWAVAERALSGYVQIEVGAATHYHASNVTPWWKPTLVKTAEVGSHVFYRWPGKAGHPSRLNGRADLEG